jgi:hypothetical protein
MPSLHACLNETPRRTLLVMTQLQGLKPSASAPKAELLQTLLQAMLDPDHVRFLLPRLDKKEREVLTTLLSAEDHRMPLRNFQWRFGPLRPYKPWRDDLPRQPWREPAGAGERPFYMGLIFLGEGPGDWRPQPYVFIPDDLVPLLSSLAPPMAAEVAHVETEAEFEAEARVETEVPDHACRDLAALLGLLHGQDVHPLHARWLPLRDLRQWNARCVCPASLAAVQSELSTGRPRVLHFLAEAAGLVELHGDCLKPTPRAWEWLAQDPATQLRTLWEVWRGVDPALWERYRMPGHQCPFILEVLGALCPHLARAAGSDWLETAAFVSAVQQQPLAVSGDWGRWTSEFRAGALTVFLTGFLAHLGVTEREAGSKE